MATINKEVMPVEVQKLLLRMFNVTELDMIFDDRPGDFNDYCCGVKSIRTLACTRPKGHGGLHIAHGTKALEAWVNDGN